MSPESPSTLGILAALEGELGALAARRIGARFGRSPEQVLERNREHGPVGTIGQAVERLKQIEEIGYERVMLQHLAHDDLDTVALIGRELAPAIA